MAYAPQGAQMINTDKSVVPGYRIKNVYVMAGVPRIMRVMLDAVIADLKTGLRIHNAAVHANVGEGEIAAALEAIQLNNPDIDIGSYPQDKDSTISDHRVIFVVKGTNKISIAQTCNDILNACAEGGYQAALK